MKKIISCILILSALILTGCKQESSQSPNSQNAEQQEQHEQHEWEMTGVWYPVINAYTGWYSGCVMKIGDLENGKFKVEFTIDDEVYFDEYVELKNDYPGQTQFSVEKDSSGWNDIHISFNDGVAFADPVGTRGGCRFEKK